jgi:hypothetical protein
VCIWFCFYKLTLVRLHHYQILWHNYAVIFWYIYHWSIFTFTVTLYSSYLFTRALWACPSRLPLKYIMALAYIIKNSNKPIIILLTCIRQKDRPSLLVSFIITDKSYFTTKSLLLLWITITNANVSIYKLNNISILCKVSKWCYFTSQILFNLIILQCG